MSIAKTKTRLPGHRPPEWQFLDNISEYLGFCAVGVIPATPVPPIAAEIYQSWTNKRYHADMPYMAKNTAIRRNPGHPGLVTDARVVLTVALAYGNGTIKDGVWQFVAGHARGRDYHKTIKGRLNQLAAAILARFPTATYRPFVDSAPIMERTAALVSGIGELGKNGAIIVDGVGPRVLLGELILSGVPTPAPPPAAPSPFNACGNCTECIQRCPTGAIVAPGIVNAAACLSYWTIESHAPILPVAMSDAMTTLFGCDICTTVCPHNRDTEGMLEKPPSAHKLPASLQAFLNEDPTHLKAALAGTALHRTGVETLKRNAHQLLLNERKRR